MRSFLKFALLAFIVVLSVSIGDRYGLRVADANSKPESFHQEDIQSYFSEAKLGKVFCLHRSAEVLVNAANNLPFPDSKKYRDNFLNNAHTLELKIQNIALQYLFQTRVIHKSLSIADIIFPFHYFW